MSYYPRDHQAGGDEVDDFDDYDPTPYGGGYDIALTYGRPLPPSEETCYPNTSSSNEDFDYDRPQYRSEAEPSAYGDEALEDEYRSYARPNRRPQDTPQPNYGFQPGGGGGSGYGGRPEYGSEHHQRPDYERPSSEFGSGYGRKPSYGEEEGDGSGYGRKPNYGGGEEGGGGRYGSGRKPSYGEEEGGEGYGSRYGRKPSYGEEEEGERYGSGYGGRPQRSENEELRYGRSDHEIPKLGGYGRPAYGTGESVRPTYAKRDDDDDDESHGPSKAVYWDDDSGIPEERRYRDFPRDGNGYYD